MLPKQMKDQSLEVFFRHSYSLDKFHQLINDLITMSTLIDQFTFSLSQQT